MMDTPDRGVVLVVDDEEIVREVMQGMLEQMGHRVVTADGGQQALSFLRDNSGMVGVVVLDVTMPVMNGEEVLREIKNLGINAKVILSSGYSRQETLGRIEASGIDGFLQKPFSYEKLEEVVNQVIQA